jgi:hypothetical protein
MTYYANLSNDLPAPYKRKRVIFYRQGLKVYGLLPYILNRKLKAQFFSGTVSCMGGTISMGSFESNWTAIPYTQSPENLKALLDWLYEDRGFEVALASREDWNDDIFSANVYRMPPHTWYPIGNEAREGFLQINSGMKRDDLIGLLALPTGEK